MFHKMALAPRLLVAASVLFTPVAFASGDKSFEDGLTATYRSPNPTGFERAFEREDDRGERRESQRKHGFESNTEPTWHHGDHGYHGHHGLSVTLVPEPATDAMLLSGLAVLLVLVRRNRSQKGR